MDQCCHHCGKISDGRKIVFDNHFFCCNGCRAVYRLIHDKDLGAFYDLYPKSGNAPATLQNYPFLDDVDFCSQLENFRLGEKVQIIIAIPSIHCSACIWILENLSSIDPGILHSEVQFSKRTLSLYYDESQTDLKKICLLLDGLGYPPDFSLSSQKKTQNPNRNRSLWIKIGIAGFAFGNTMFLSLATYFETDEAWLIALRPWFDLLMFLMSLPVVFFAAKDYFIQSWKSIRNQYWSLDLPISIGITVLFLKSIHNVFVLQTLGYFDSLCGLVFFLLIGSSCKKGCMNPFLLSEITNLSFPWQSPF